MRGPHSELVAPGPHPALDDLIELAMCAAHRLLQGTSEDSIDAVVARQLISMLHVDFAGDVVSQHCRDCGTDLNCPSPSPFHAARCGGTE